VNTNKVRLLNRSVLGRTALCLMLAAAFLAAGCAREEIDPAKKPLVDAVKKMGGMKKASSWTTRTEKGLLKVNWPGWGDLQADCTRFVKKPDKAKIDRDFSAFDHPFFMTYYYNAGDGWAVVNLGVRQSPNITSMMKEFVDRANGLAYYLEECDTFFLISEVPDDSLMAGSGLERVGCVHDGDTILFDVNMDSKLPVRITENGGARVSILEDFRKADGMRVPFHLTIYENGQKRNEYIWNEISYDDEIDDTVFEEDRPPAPESGE